MSLPAIDYGKIIRWSTTVLAIVLAIPVGLILVTWNALPGDQLYATKRNLETIPRLAFGGNLTLAAQYETKITDRRFFEATTLVKKKNTDGFNDLRQSIRETAQKVKLAKDPAIKKAYIAQLQSYQTALDKEKQILIAAAITTPVTPPETPPSTTPTNPPSSNTTPTNPTKPTPTTPTTPTTPPTAPPPSTPQTPPTTPPTTPPPTTPPPTTPPPPSDPEDPIDTIDETQDEIDDIIEDLEKQDLDDLSALEAEIGDVEK